MADSLPKNSRCVVCSPSNPRSLGLEVRPAHGDDDVEAEYTADATLQGPPGVLHGGMQAALLDDVAVYAVQEALGQLPLTASMTVDYKRPVPVEAPLQLAGRVVERDASRVAVEARLLLAGEVATTARFDMRVLDDAP